MTSRQPQTYWCFTPSKRVRLSQGDPQTSLVRLIRHNPIIRSPPPPPPPPPPRAARETKDLGLTGDGETTAERKKETTARFNNTGMDDNKKKSNQPNNKQTTYLVKKAASKATKKKKKCSREASMTISIKMKHSLTSDASVRAQRAVLQYYRLCFCCCCCL